MEIIGSLCILFGISIFLYTVIKRYEAQRVGASKIKKQMGIQKQKEEEQSRRNIIINKVENFLKTSKFVEPIAKWREEDVYKYVFNDGYLYEFEDIMTENNQKVGMDEDFLCFKRLFYKRVANPVDFMSKFSESIALIKNNSL